MAGGVLAQVVEGLQADERVIIGQTGGDRLRFRGMLDLPLSDAGAAWRGGLAAASTQAVA